MSFLFESSKLGECYVLRDQRILNRTALSYSQHLLYFYFPFTHFSDSQPLCPCTMRWFGSSVEDEERCVQFEERREIGERSREIAHKFVEFSPL